MTVATRQYSDAVSALWNRRRGVVAPSLSSVLIGTFLVIAPAGAFSASPALATTTTTTLAPTTTTTTVPTSTTTTTPTSTTTTTTTVPTSTTTTTIPHPAVIPWPSGLSSAVSIPQLRIFATSPNQPQLPIASITKLMTTWVILHRLPLAINQRGPCHVVSAGDYAVYQHDLVTDQSNVRLVRGMTLCEGTLLRGLLVHSAGDYAHMLVEMTGFSLTTFVRVMNRDAHVLGLHSTHYVEVTGIDSRDVSTARDQTILAIDLMNAEPIVRDIVTLPQVALPGAGVVSSYTPFVGEGGVIGVKSGFTGAAGGCDVMAINFVVGTQTVTAYAVVLGDHGPNPIVGSGVAALALARSLRPYLRLEHSRTGADIVWTASPIDVVGTAIPKTTWQA